MGAGSLSPLAWDKEGKLPGPTGVGQMVWLVGEQQGEPKGNMPKPRGNYVMLVHLFNIPSSSNMELIIDTKSHVIGTSFISKRINQERISFQLKQGLNQSVQGSILVGRKHALLSSGLSPCTFFSPTTFAFSSLSCIYFLNSLLGRFPFHRGIN